MPSLETTKAWTNFILATATRITFLAALIAVVLDDPTRVLAELISRF